MTMKALAVPRRLVPPLVVRYRRHPPRRRLVSRHLVSRLPVPVNLLLAVVALVSRHRVRRLAAVLPAVVPAVSVHPALAV